MKREVLPSNDLDNTANEPLPGPSSGIEPNIPLSPIPSSIASEYTSSEVSGRYSSLDSQETSDEDTFGNDDDDDDDDDVLIIGLSKKERQEVDRWDKLLSRRGM